jgi:two-component system response regulator HydG
VLVVDDDDDVRQTVRIILEDEGYHVDEAPDGMLALERLRESPLGTVVLLDLQMPRMDGRQVLQAVAAHTELAQRHAYILLSAQVDRRLPSAVRRLLADLHVGVLGKPFDVEQLLAMVQDAARTLT